MTHPIVHMNGTSRESLQQQNLDAVLAVSCAIEALQNAAPHGRDYYPLGNDAYNRAHAEWCSRIDRLTAVRDELTAIVDHLDNNG